MIQLRKYQEEALQNIQSRFEAGVQRQCLVLPTGAGKTVVFSHIPKIHPGRTLILAHREELLSQAADAFCKINPDLAPPELEQGENYASDYAETIIASVPTLGREGSRRIQRFPPFDNIICDEAHHSLAVSYQNIFGYFGFPCDGSLTAPHGSLLLGVTATPKRTDNIGLDHILQEVVYSRSIRQQIEEGYSVDILPFRIVSQTSLDGIGSRAGDYAENELAARVDNEERNHLAVNAYIQHALGKKAIVFCANLKHVASVTLLFQRSGVAVESVDGATPKLIRAAIFERYRTGKTKVLVNCGVATEGFDDPTTECIIMLRPTKSQLLYIQMLGRGLRVTCDLQYYVSAEGRLEAIAKSSKPKLLLLDIVDNCSKNSPIMLPILFGMNKDLETRGEGIFKVLKKLEEAKSGAPHLSIDSVTDIGKLQEMTAKALKINIWDSVDLTKEVKQYSTLSWMKSEQDDYFLTLNKHETMEIRENTLGQFEAIIERTATYNDVSDNWEPCPQTAEVLGHSGTLEEALVRSDSYVKEAYPSIIGLVVQNAQWKKDQASLKQFEKLQKWRVPVVERDGKYFCVDGKTGETKPLTKGLAGALMGKKLEEFKARKKV